MSALCSKGMSSMTEKHHPLLLAVCFDVLCFLDLIELHNWVLQYLQIQTASFPALCILSLSLKKGNVTLLKTSPSSLDFFLIK